MAFGKRTTPFGARPTIPTPPRDSDGKRRIFGEATFAGPHGAMLRDMGFALDDPTNVLPEPVDVDRAVRESLDEQDQRRRKIDADLLARHGHNAIRPFFILAEPVFNSDLGQWLIRVMRLRPYDAWNLVYLPTDRATQRIMGDVPMHPLQSVTSIDELMVKQIGQFRTKWVEARRKVDAHINDVGADKASPVMEKFVAYSDAMPQQIIDHVTKVKPMIVDLIADVQRRAA